MNIAIVDGRYEMPIKQSELAAKPPAMIDDPPKAGVE